MSNFSTSPRVLENARRAQPQIIELLVDSLSSIVNLFFRPISFESSDSILTLF